MRSNIRIPLPEGWSRTIRSGVIQAISLANFALTHTRSWAANSINARIRLTQENHRLRQEVALLVEEMRIKDSRMLRIAAQRRPHFPPVERHPDPGPVNRFPDFVSYIVRRLKSLCPSMGKVKIAQVLCRVGLHLAPTTVWRKLQEPPPRRRRQRARDVLGRRVIATRPNLVWLTDLTTVPTSFGFWCAWLPFALPQCWPFCWWDHESRSCMSCAAIRATSEVASGFAVRCAAGQDSGTAWRVRLELNVRYLAGRKHLPIVELNRVA